MPFVLAALGIVHIIALHEDGSNNPIGIRSDIDKVPFHHYYALKDLYGVVVFIMVLSIQIDYPDNLPDALQKSRQQFEEEAKWAMAVKLFEMKRLSSGMAANLIGVDRVSFLLKLKDYGVSMIDLMEEKGITVAVDEVFKSKVSNNWQMI